MSYILDQFNQPMFDKLDVDDESNRVYLTSLKEGTASRRKAVSDNGVTGAAPAITFYDECVKLPESLKVDTHYYLHSKVRRTNSDQVFYIYLVNYNDANKGKNEKTQFVKTVTVKGGPITEWVDLEFQFTPILSFDCILFQLQRTIDDYTSGNTRYPVIVYEELSIINNMLYSKVSIDASLLKIGVQSRPGLMMCINGQEIRTGRTGVYEVRNGTVAVEFFSVIFAADEKPTLEYNETYKNLTLEEYLYKISEYEKDPVTDIHSTTSRCIFANPKTRDMSGFTLDYMYKD